MPSLKPGSNADHRVNYDDLMAEFQRKRRAGQVDGMIATIVGRDPSPPASSSLPRRHGP